MVFPPQTLPCTTPRIPSHDSCFEAGGVAETQCISRVPFYYLRCRVGLACTTHTSSDLGGIIDAQAFHVRPSIISLTPSYAWSESLKVVPVRNIGRVDMCDQCHHGDTITANIDNIKGFVWWGSYNVLQLQPSSARYRRRSLSPIFAPWR